MKASIISSKAKLFFSLLQTMGIMEMNGCPKHDFCLKIALCNETDFINITKHTELLNKGIKSYIFILT